jgi:oligopeptide/dipeptide ABC transporter ATP-binding protein
LLEVKNLKTSFFTPAGEVKAVDDVSFSISKGKTLVIVGESGCGKTVTGLSLLRLISPPGKIVSGEIIYQGKDLLTLSQSEMRKIRGNEISMIFQDPGTSLNPVFTIGNQIRETIALHQKLPKKETANRAVEMLRMVGIASPEQRINDYPHQLSGGMKQRVMIAMALACNPHLLIADEPTTSLDVTVQFQILELLKDLQKRVGMAMIFITHDFGAASEIGDDLMVMYAGQVVEYGNAQEILKNPKMPYTKALLDSIPVPGKKKLDAIPGMVPNLMKLPGGCRFQDRCKFVLDDCKKEIPQLREKKNDQKSIYVRCIRDL